MNGKDNGPVPAGMHVMAPKPVRFLFCPGKVTTIEELATCLGMMGLGVVGPGGYQALEQMGVEHLFEREQQSQIVTPNVALPSGMNPA